jgi:HD-like signal output (HDOD) protein
MTPPAAGKKRIGELLVEADLVSADAVTEALEWQRKSGGRLVGILVAMGALSVEEFARFLVREQRIPSVALDHYEVPPEVLGLLSREFCLQHEVLPLDKMGNSLTIGMACPLDAATIAKIEQMTGLRVRGLLCSLEDIQAALREHYGSAPEIDDVIQRYDAPQAQFERRLAPKAPATPASAAPAPAAAMAGSEVRLEFAGTLLARLTAVPPLPETIARVKSAIDNPDAELRDVVSIIKEDPGVSGRLLSLVNSAAFGLSQRVASVETAAALLGMSQVYSVVLSAAALDFFEKAVWFDRREFMRKAELCSLGTQVLGRMAGIPNTNGLFRAGLLHDIGRLGLALVAPHYAGESAVNTPDAAAVPVERERFGLTHCEAGYILAHTWNLPDDLAQAIRFHFRPDLATAGTVMVSAVALAAALAEQKLFPTEDEVVEDPRIEYALAALHLEAATLPIILHNIEEALESKSQQ